METPDGIPETDQRMSFLDKLTNLFASPGALFENVRQTGPTNSNWLAPWLIFVTVSIATSQLMLTSPSLSNQLEVMLKKQLSTPMEDAIKEGKITQEQADQQVEQYAKPGSAWFTMLSMGGVLTGSIVVLFALALFYNLLGRSVMNATVPYLKVVEVVGLTFLISSLERIVTTSLMFVTDSINASPSLVLFLSGIDLENKFHVALSKINLFTFWDLTITSFGLSTLFQRDFPKVFVLIFALWLLWSVFTLFTGFSLGG